MNQIKDIGYFSGCRLGERSGTFTSKLDNSAKTTDEIVHLWSRAIPKT
jgi:hypothetical protein